MAPNERVYSAMSFKHTFVRGYYNQLQSYLRNRTKQLEAETKNGSCL